MRHVPSLQRIAIAVVTLSLAAVLATPSVAAPRARWALADIAVEGEGEPMQQAQVVASLRALAKTTEGFAADAPDPRSDPDGFKAFVAKRKLTAFDVRIKIVKLACGPAKDASGQALLECKAELELLGVTRPASGFGFTGHGDATVGAQVGGKVPPKLEGSLRGQALDAALARALAQATTELTAKAKAKGKK